ncbi:Hypoxanthine-guanine phosphoribosyltransferase [Planctomycetes bacterium Pan216]|uniref:Hypoxanthine phosphoribosyltransferase n=1 Tax=Kolteria novifilia TaxID=2527975 RepID=A0A518B909_9BACT|nr:Hypoxanthine-guanine phosphoribosyltransferase [Planctomycetes bacterium Pan216]
MTDRLREIFSAEQIAQRVRELAEQISRDYHDKPLVIVGVLKGAFIFLADLVRELSIEPTIEFVRLSSYGLKKESNGEVEMILDVKNSLEGKHVLVVEDIVDTGLSIKSLSHRWAEVGLASLRVCTLLDKPARRKTDIEADYVGFSIDDLFVVGFGLDWAEKYRHLHGIYVVEFDADE